jgi:hypothetical protein
LPRERKLRIVASPLRAAHTKTLSGRSVQSARRCGLLTFRRGLASHKAKSAARRRIDEIGSSSARSKCSPCRW